MALSNVLEHRKTARTRIPRAPPNPDRTFVSLDVGLRRILHPLSAWASSIGTQRPFSDGHLRLTGRSSPELCPEGRRALHATMPFRVAARTILHLGSELISSDSIAFYELIKNAFDARAPKVTIDVVVRLPAAEAIRTEIAEFLTAAKTANQRKEALEGFRVRMLEAIDRKAMGAEQLEQLIWSEPTLAGFITLLRRANYITISDTGMGMNLADLQDIYLTIGTSHRRRERQAIEKSGDLNARPVLGEKGVGRLSAMRLGSLLHLETSKFGEKNWNILDIDWEMFSHDSDHLIESIPLEPAVGSPKLSTATSGTTLTILSLNADWTRQKLTTVATTEFSKLNDPFTPNARYPVLLRFNGEPVAIPPLNTLLFDAAHAIVSGNFEVQTGNQGWSGLTLNATMDYVSYRRTKKIALANESLRSCTSGISLGALRSLGPVSVKFYWFNRRILDEIDGIGDQKKVRALVKDWAGGLMVFRDGFRVNPYGGPDDDWLDLDSAALSSTGYKVNRQQIIGKVDITTLHNPKLTDQTNREGLCDCDEKRALVALMKALLINEFKPFIDAVDKETKQRAPVSIAELRDNVLERRRDIKKVIALLTQQFPAVKSEGTILPAIEQSLDHISESVHELERAAKNLKDERSELLHLAGIGMMVEIVVHELWRTTHSSMRLLNTLGKGVSGEKDRSTLRTLEAQMNTLQRRLKMIDPVASSTRQVKETFDLAELVRDVISAHQDQFERHHVAVSFEIKPKSANCDVKLVRGMIVQIIENLFSNAVYWLKQRKEVVAHFDPRLHVTLDTDRRTLSVSDNGPGVAPERKEEIFAPFVTTKPPGEGRGMGLYISREIARYHKSELILSDEPTEAGGNLSTFVLKLSSAS